jgi:sodium/bile acid cotransporter 7
MHLVVLALLTVLLLALVLLIITLTSRTLGFGRDDEAALIFCGSQKSLVSGVPIAAALIPGADVGPILLPMMLYYPMQLLICAWIARRYSADQMRRNATPGFETPAV